MPMTWKDVFSNDFVSQEYVIIAKCGYNYSSSFKSTFCSKNMNSYSQGPLLKNSSSFKTTVLYASQSFNEFNTQLEICYIHSSNTNQNTKSISNNKTFVQFHYKCESGYKKINNLNLKASFAVTTFSVQVSTLFKSRGQEQDTKKCSLNLRLP